MPDPVFTDADRVPPPQTGLPAELANMTPQQIAEHYQRREQTIRQQAQAAIAQAGAGARPEPQATPPPPRSVSQAEFDEDPLAATRTLITQEGVTRQEFQQLTQAAQATMIQSAKFQASQGKKYWNRLSSLIDQITRGTDPLTMLDSSFWETAYQAALGQSFETIQAEERAAAAAAASSTSEPVSGAPQLPPAPRSLTFKEIAICDGLGITQDQFRRGEENIRNNVFPVTLDNRRK